MSLQERRARLVDAAVRVIAREGVPAATTRAIVAEAGMPLASFHYAFESHSELMREVILKTVQQEQDSLPMNMDGATLPETIRFGLEGYLDMLRRDPRSEQAQMELRHFGLRSAEHRALVTEMVEQQYVWVEQLMDDYATRHELIYRVPTRQMAIQLITIADGLTMAILVGGDSDLLRATIKPLADSFAQYVR